jgi:hypothetical protein
MSDPASQPVVQYQCPSCHLHLITWDRGGRRIEMFHKIGLWADFWTGDVRLVCQSCQAATAVVPGELVSLLRDRLGIAAPVRDERRRSTSG